MRRPLERTLVALLALLLAVPLAPAGMRVRSAALPASPLPPAGSEEENERQSEAAEVAAALGHSPPNRLTRYGPQRRHPFSTTSADSGVPPGLRHRFMERFTTDCADAPSLRAAMLQTPFPPPSVG